MQLEVTKYTYVKFTEDEVIRILAERAGFGTLPGNIQLVSLNDHHHAMPLSDIALYIKEPQDPGRTA